MSGRERSAAAEVLRKGRASGLEYLAGYDQRTGERLATVSGEPDRVQLSPEMSTLAAEPTSALVLVHNHPNGSSLSRQDLLLLSNSPGIRRLQALGHDGSIYTAEAERPLPEERYDLLRMEMRRDWMRAIKDVLVSAEDAELLAVHALNVGLQRLGYIDYRFNLMAGRKEAYDRNTAAFEAIVASVVARLK